jgi:hypothetical protein
MKRRSLLWFVASALLALLAGVLAVVFLQRAEPAEEAAVPEQLVVVARSPIAENEVIRIDYVSLEARDDFPSDSHAGHPNHYRDK